MKRRWPWVALTVVLVALLAGWLALDSVATRVTQGRLAKLPGYIGSVERVRVRLVPPGATLEGLSIDRRLAGGKTQPILRAPEVKARVRLRSLRNGPVEATVHVEKPVVSWTPAPRARPRPEAPAEAKRKFVLRRLTVEDGTVWSSSGGRTRVLEDLDAEVRGLSTLPAPPDKLPVDFELSARMLGGTVQARGKAAPLGDVPRVRAAVTARGLPLAELAEAMAAPAALRKVSGTLALDGHFMAGARLRGEGHARIDGLEPGDVGRLRALAGMASEVAPGEVGRWLGELGEKLGALDSKGEGGAPTLEANVRLDVRLQGRSASQVARDIGRQALAPLVRKALLQPLGQSVDPAPTWGSPDLPPAGLPPAALALATP